MRACLKGGGGWGVKLPLLCSRVRGDGLTLGVPPLTLHAPPPHTTHRITPPRYHPTRPATEPCPRPPRRHACARARARTHARLYADTVRLPAAIDSTSSPTSPSPPPSREQPVASTRTPPAAAIQPARTLPAQAETVKVRRRAERGVGRWRAERAQETSTEAGATVKGQAGTTIKRCYIWRE